MAEAEGRRGTCGLRPRSSMNFCGRYALMSVSSAVWKLITTDSHTSSVLRTSGAYAAATPCAAVPNPAPQLVGRSAGHEDTRVAPAAEPRRARRAPALTDLVAPPPPYRVGG